MLVGDALLDRRHSAPMSREEIAREADAVEEEPRRLVELAHVMHHVHVADVIAVPGVHHAGIGLERLGHFVSLNSSRPMSILRISDVPAPIS